jgi:signal transduction histidine kinase
MAAVEAARGACLTASVRTWSPVERADREDALAGWIASHGGDAALAGQLVDTGVSLEMLERLAGLVSGSALDVALKWMASGCLTSGLAMEIERGAARVFEIVSAVKGFTQMDRAPVAQPVDVGKGIRDAMIVLRSKASAKSVSLKAEVDPVLPPVQGMGAELNQIWANLIDNALDAVGTGGQVEVTARGQEGRVVVEVTDNGPGIPPDARERIFDPFFSTKDVGKGVGLGLDIVRRSLERHDGEIEVESRPGRTVFRVTLPAEGMRSSGRWSRSGKRIQIEGKA